MRNHELIHRLTTGAHLTPKVQMDAADEIIRMERENAALREVLTRIKGHADFDGQDIAVVLMGRLETIYGAAGGALAATEGHSQGDGYYAVALHPDGTSTDLKKPYCRDCGSNDASMEDTQQEKP